MDQLNKCGIQHTNTRDEEPQYPHLSNMQLSCLREDSGSGSIGLATIDGLWRAKKPKRILHWNFDSPHFQFECIALKWKPFLRRYSAQKPIRFCVDRGLYQHISARPQKSSTNNRDKESERERERARNEEREPHKLCKMPLKCGIIDFSGMALRMYRTYV